MVEVPSAPSNVTPPDNAMYLAWIPNADPALPGSIIAMDLQKFSTVIQSGNQLVVTAASYNAETGVLTLTYSNGSAESTQDMTIQVGGAQLPSASNDDVLIYENGAWGAEKVHGDNIATGTIQTNNILDGAVTASKLGADVELNPVIGTVRLCFFDDQDVSYGFQANGAYDVEVLDLEESVQAGDKILVQCGAIDGGGQFLLRTGNQDTPLQATVDGFCVFDAPAAATSFSIRIQGTYTGQVRYQRRAVYCCRGTNDLALGAMKAALVSAVDPENFPPGFSATRIYVPGEKFHYQNAVYEVIRHVINQAPPNVTYYTKVLDAAAVSNSDIDARIADWAEQGNTSQIPMSKIPDIGTDGIPANLVENFAKTNFPETTVPPDKLPDINITQSAGSARIDYSGNTQASYSPLSVASDTVAGLMTPTQKSQLDGLPSWVTDGSRAPKNRLPSDVVYGLPTFRGEWNSAHSYSDGEIVKATPTGPSATPRFFLAVRDNSNINPLQSNSSWIELGVHQSIGIRVRGLWARSQEYLPGDVVVHQDELLLCTVGRPANTDTEPLYTQWDVLMHMGLDVTPDGTLQFTLWNEGSQLEYRAAAGARFLFNRGDWTARRYYPQNVVREVGQRYICKVEHDASSSNQPGSSTAVNWETYWERW